jgi:hypothetical protein
MGAKAEVGWTRRTDEGVKVEVYAQHVGRRWLFYSRAKRHDQWEAMKEPPLVDWLELLDAVERMIPRRRYMPVDAERLRKTIRELFPGTEV